MADDFSTYEGRQAYRDAHPGAIVDASGAYDPNTGQSVSGGQSAGVQQYQDQGLPNSANPQMTQMLLNDAQNRAQAAYNQAKLNLDSDQEAYMKAYYAAQTAFAEAGVTGTYQGNPTLAAQEYYANTFGNWGTPTAGQQTLTAQQQAFNQAQALAQLTGYYNGPGATTGPSQQQYVAARTQQLQGMGFDPTRAAQTAQSEWAQGLAQQGNVAGGLPSGINFSSQGQQTLAGQQQAFNQQAQLAQLYGQYYAPGQGPASGATTLTAQQQAYNQWLQAQQLQLSQQTQQQNTANQYLTLLSNLRGPADYAKYQQVLGSTPGGMQDLVRAAAGQYVPGGGATTGVAPTPVSLQSFIGSATGGQPSTADTSSQAAMQSLVAPNQMAPQTWNALTPSQQQMLLGTWESQGYTKDDAQALFNQSLPKYASSSVGAGSFRLQ